MALVVVVLCVGWMHHGSGEAVGLLQKARPSEKTGWKSLAIWNGAQEEEKAPEPVSEPEWLKHYMGQAKGKNSFVGDLTEGEMDEVKALRGRMSEAERQLEEAQAQLNGAEDDLKHPYAYAGSEVQSPIQESKQQHGPRLEVSPRLVTNGQMVVAEWEGMTEVTEHDFIGVYTPPGADNHDYVELHNVTEATTWREGKGKIHLRLFNHRKQEGYELRYFRKGKFHNDSAVFLSTDSTIGTMLYCPRHHCRKDVYFLVTSSQPVIFPAHEPTQTRLALTGVPTEMRVMWVSDKCPSAPLGGAVVLYSATSCAGDEDCGYEQKVKPMFRTYGAEDLCGPPANVEGARGFMDPGYIYDAVMSDLEPGVRYYYRVGCQDAPDGWKEGREGQERWAAGSMMSEEKSFVAPPWIKKQQQVSFIAYAESGVTTWDDERPISFGMPERVNAGILAEVEQGNVGMVLHMGGMSYSYGRSAVWEQWGKLVEPIAESVPYMVTNGNLEYDHLPSVSVTLSQPAAAEKVWYVGMQAPFGPALLSSMEPTSATITTAKGVTSSLCLNGTLSLEEEVDAKERYRGKIVVVASGTCEAGSKAQLAQELGAVGVIMHERGHGVDKLFYAAQKSADKYGAVSIPTVFVSEDDGHDLRTWVWDHAKVTGELRSSLALQTNDPSLTQEEKAASPTGFHPGWSDSFMDDSRGECGVPYAQRFHMPENGNGNFWYTIEYGSVTIVVISTEHDWTKGSRQYNWIKATLKAIDRTVTPWVVVSMHRSLYGRTLRWSWQEVSNYMQQSLEPLFKKYEVNLVLSGQERRYLRTAPVYKDLNMAKKEAGGPVYAVVGTGGGTLFYRARDDVHRSYYCVGGNANKQRCDCHWGYWCNDNTCCDHELSGAPLPPERSNCGYCERINATGPGEHQPSSPAGPRNPHDWGWVRSQHSAFGYAKITVESATRMRLDWVRTFQVEHSPTVDSKGRSLHVPSSVHVGCREHCTKEGHMDEIGRAHV